MFVKARSFARQWWHYALVVGFALAMIWFFFAPVSVERLTADPWCNLIYSSWHFSGNGSFRYSVVYIGDYDAHSTSYSGRWLHTDNIINVQMNLGEAPKGKGNWQLRSLAGSRLLFVLKPDDEIALLYRCNRGS